MFDIFRRKTVLNVVIVAAVFLLFGVGLFLLSGDVDKVAERVAARRVLMQTRYRTVEALSHLKQDESLAVAYQRQMDLLLPDKDEMFYLPQWLNGLARAHQIDLTFSVTENGAAAGPGAPGFVRFSVTARGEYANVISFLKDAESKQQRFLVALDEIDLRKMAEGSYQISGNARAFYK